MIKVQTYFQIYRIFNTKIFPIFIFNDRGDGGGGSESKKSCLVISKDLNELETLLIQNVKIQFWSKVIAISISAIW